ncbi:MAG: PHP domain-containing protein [Bacteroidales bacterium]|nr:PHP domain-containing protein [Bacteroidales bacterium]
MKADLHFHSKFSDGTLWPEEIVKQAKEMDFEVIALTDHDTLSGVERFIQACREMYITGIPAVEIDYDPSDVGYESELLAYFPGANYTRTLTVLDELQKRRRDIASVAIDIESREYGRKDLSIHELIRLKINDPSAEFNPEEISITKPDIFRYFHIKSVLPEYRVNDYIKFKTEFFDRQEFRDISESKPGFREWINIINDDGGFAVLAHPAYHYNLDINLIKADRENLLDKFLQFKQMGLWGIELHPYNIKENGKILNGFFRKLAEETGLKITIGSDYHGSGTDKDVFGEFYGDFGGFER